MAVRILSRSLLAPRCKFPVSVFKSFRFLSQVKSKTYENILVEVPKSGVGFSIPLHLPLVVHICRSSTDVSVVE